MKVVTVPYEKLGPADQKSVDEGYSYGCMCGESYKTQEAAEDCRKCRDYLEKAPTQVYFTPAPGAGQ